jgi:hypothetical protein
MFAEPETPVSLINEKPVELRVIEGGKRSQTNDGPESLR